MRLILEVLRYIQGDPVSDDLHWFNWWLSAIRQWALTLQWCHGVSNHQQVHCLLNHLFWGTSMKTCKLHVTGPLWLVDFPHKGPVIWKIFPWHDICTILHHWAEDVFHSQFKYDGIDYTKLKGGYTGSTLSVIDDQPTYCNERSTVLLEHFWWNWNGIFNSGQFHGLQFQFLFQFHGLLFLFQFRNWIGISSTQVSDSHLSPPGALQSRRASLQWT